VWWLGLVSWWLLRSLAPKNAVKSVFFSCVCYSSKYSCLFFAFAFPLLLPRNKRAEYAWHCLKIIIAKHVQVQCTRALVVWERVAMLEMLEDF
jgi:hypothetical protein